MSIAYETETVKENGEIVHYFFSGRIGSPIGWYSAV